MESHDPTKDNAVQTIVVPQDNGCHQCKEGFTLDDKIYCSADGQFYLPQKRAKCRNFVKK